MSVILIPNGFQNHYTVGFANGIAANNIKIQLISSDNIDNKQLLNSINAFNLRGSHLPERNVFEKIKNYLSYYIKLIKHIYADHKTVVHITGPIKYHILDGIILNRVIKMLSKRLILTVHNILPHDNETRFLMYIFKIIYRIPDYLIVHTRKVKEELISEYHIGSQKIFIMEHGINDTVPANIADQNECRKKLNIPINRTVLLFFGNIAPYKGVDLLLKAFEMTDKENLFLVIAGREKSDDYKNQIIDMLTTNKNKNNILHKIMFIPDDEVSLYFNAADVLVLPYRHIDQSGVIFLAWKFGLPIIAFDVGTFSEYIDENCGIIVKIISAESLKVAINNFVKTKEKYCRDRIIQKADRFAWNKVVKNILPLYEL